jgi:SOS-response transcriptional repressor LexA
VWVAEEYGEDAFAMTVADDAMQPMFLQGEMLVFDPALAPDAGDYVLARVGGNVLFRRYRPGQGGGGTFMLDALNDSYAPVWSDREQVTILGVLVEHHRLRSARKQNTN